MFDLIITAVGRAIIPIKDSKQRHKVVRIQVVDKEGNVVSEGFFGLMDLLAALNGDDNIPVKVESAFLGGPLTFKEKKS